MNVHHGKIIETQVFRSGKKKQEIAKQLGITRQTFANKFKTPNLPIDFILQVGKILNYDFSQDIPQLRQFALTIARESSEEYIPASTKEDWKEKYLQLLETHNRLLMEKESTNQMLVNAIELLRKDLQRYFRASEK